MATKAAWLSYIGGYTQHEVAQKLQVSSAKAHRLIALAHAADRVKIFVQGDIIECVELEEKIRTEFSLKTCTVVPDADMQQREFSAVGSAAAHFLYQLLHKCSDTVIGVGKGRTLSAMVDHLPHFKGHALKFVSVSGGLTRRFSTNPYDVIHRLAEKTQGEAYFLPVPYMAKDSAEKRLLLEQQGVKKMLNFAKSAEIVVLGLGAMHDNSHVMQTGLIEPLIWQQMQQADAVGDFMGRFLDINGHNIDHPGNELALGLNPSDLKDKRVVALIGGTNKATAALAALNTGYISDVIIGEQTAQQLLAKLPTV